MNEEIISLDINGMELLYENGNFAVLDIELLHLGENRNKCNISRECVEKSLPSFYNKYIIYRFENMYWNNDFGEHNRSETDSSMQILGHFSVGAKTSFVEDHGKTYLKMEGVISKLYQPKAWEIIKARKNLKVSIELKPIVSHRDENGILVIDEFDFLGVCLLGEKFMEAIEGSHAEILKYSVDAATKCYLQFSENIKIPEKVKENAKTALDLRKTQKRGGTSAAISIGKFLANNEFIPYGKAKKIYEYLSSHENDNVQEQTPTNGYISYMLYGGDLEWAKGIVNNYREKEETVMNSDVVGTGETVKVDKSKNSVSEKEWGSVNKTELRNKVLEAKNYKTLVKDVYLVVEDGWETVPSEKLKYPVMCFENGELVYNRYGLASALGYAKKENETEAINKAEGIYKKLDIKDGENVKNKLDEDNKDIEKIKDDADAIEDDVKEVDNAVDKLAEKKLEDDVEADKDYWKKKYACDMAAMTEKCAKAEAEVKKYVLEKENIEKEALLKKFAKLFTEEEMKEAVKCSKAEVDEKIKNKSMEFAAKKMECDDEDEVEETVKNSFGFPVSYFRIKQDNDSELSMAEIIKKYKKKN